MQNFDAGSLSRPQKVQRVKEVAGGRWQEAGGGQIYGWKEDAGRVRRGMRGRFWAMRLRSRTLLCLFAAACSLPPAAFGQVRPTGDWRTVHTEHFRVHFLPALSTLAAQTAANAELAYERLAAELTPPSGIVDIVVADNVDFTNGYAQVFPTNRIVVYARPPVDIASLRSHADWNLILVTHELAHIFHLDRAAGWWGTARRIFGRAPGFFPNTYAPAWMTEGLAVHYESKYGIGGRLNGSDFKAHVSAAAIAGSLPPLDALSLSRLEYPEASGSYIYGAFAMSHDGPREMRTFVEASSASLIPWTYQATSKTAFGERFTVQWEKWRDSVMQAERAIGNPAAGESGRGEAIPGAADSRLGPSGAVRVLTSHPYSANFPRFTSDSTLVYVGDDGTTSTGLYSLTLDGRRERIGRRTGADAPAWLSDGRWLQAEYDYTDPYSLRTDLTVGTGMARRRITHGARVSSPDVHRDNGRILALRTDPGTTSIIEFEGGAIYAPRTIVEGTLDRVWSEPRWSRSGTRIAAARWERGGTTSIVVMDERGAELSAITPRGAPFSVVSSPVWEPGDTTLLFVSDHEGRSQIYRANLGTGTIGLVWGTRTALAMPDVSPDGKRIAAVVLAADGYHVVERETPTDVAMVFIEAAPPPPPVAAEPIPLDTTITARADGTRYNARDHLGIAWWMPIVESTGTGNLRVGAHTSARDLIGRHSYDLAISYELENQEEGLEASYTYAGLGNPIISLQGASDWRHAPIYDNTNAFVGYLGLHSSRLSAAATLLRSRVRVRSDLTVGAQIARASYRTYPGSLISQLDPRFTRRYVEPSYFAAARLSTMQYPRLSPSATNGVSVDVQHFEQPDGGLDGEATSQSQISATVAKSVPIAGLTKHVVALRGAYGVTGHRSAGGFGVGGISGSSIELLPGYYVGDSRRTFGVRGFPDSRQAGVRAVVANAEYRAPLAIIGRGLGLWPLFFQRSTVTGFMDTGAAWCSFEVPGSYLCTPESVDRTWMKSYGIELGVDAAIHYDWTYRFRLGIAHPYRGRAFAEANNTVYFAIGSSW